MARVIDGKALAAKVRQEIADEVAALKLRGIVPGLAVILVGDDPASEVYVRGKQRACEEVGIYSRILRLPATTSQEKLLSLIYELNTDPAIHGILVQLPVPEEIDPAVIQAAIAVEKDVDGFHPASIGRLWAGERSFVPCTPLGIMRMLEEYDVKLQGKKAVVVGRSNIVGKPMAALLLQQNATVTICHSRTENLADECRSADVLVVAIGRPKFIPGNWIKPGAVVIDVGINRVEGRLVGDVDYEGASAVAEMITPVPGGVGPMTIAMLLANTVQGARNLAG
ncbi:MAG: bifunctional methylenetetrahydrofolate dehydrogenase/methenyltetrahydrofolate cyclohydrolase FolD [Firmicutes bacterium]|nr:bifunctional methylenetetrahydrofolate dehydrogenase/methenyltetrahydrofolate cyclohydrolase FolD [Bacillota bacterium]